MFKGSALKLSHSSVCSVFQNPLPLYPIATQSLGEEEEGEGGPYSACHTRMEERTSPNMMIEKATVSDAEEILSLQKLAYRSEAEIHNDFNIPPLVQTLEEIKNDYSNQIFLKATADGKIRGSVRAFGKEGTCYIGRLIVHPDFQNQGIGTKLMAKIEEIFEDAKRFELFTGHKSKKNLYLYQKLGYKIFKTKKANDRVNIVYLEKKIEPSF